MTCHVLAEGLKEDEAAQLESIEIDRHGLVADETGTLWNRQRTSTAPAERTRAEKPWSRAKFNVRLWRRLMAEGPLLHRLALEVGTEEDWLRHCARCERDGGKVGG
jgi:hypothetical protein